MKLVQLWLNLPLGDHPIESGKPKLRNLFKIIHIIPFSAVKLRFGVTCPNLNSRYPYKKTSRCS